MDDWVVRLQTGRADDVWDPFLDRYRRLLFAAIRHYAQDYDDVMDVFAWVCDALRANDLRRLRAYADRVEHRARFSTWLVTVVHRLTVDWFRHRDGRRRLSVIAQNLFPLQRSIYRHVFLEHHSHVEAYELVRSREAPELTYREFLTELRATYRAATENRRGQVLRAIGSVPAESPDLELPEPDGNHEHDARLAEAMATLSPEDRVAVELYVVEGLPAADVARILGLANPKAAYNRVYRALARLREHLERAGVQRDES